MRVQSVVNTNHGLQITYVNEDEIDADTGILVARTLDMPHDVLDQVLMDELTDWVVQVVEAARVLRHQPRDEYRTSR